MISIPRYDTIKDSFTSEQSAIDYLVKKLNQFHLNSHFSNDDDFHGQDQPEVEHPDTRDTDSGVLIRHQSDLENVALPNANIINDSNDTKKNEKNMDDISQKNETSAKVMMYHALNSTDSITFQQNLLQRAKLPCHLLLYVSHLWLAGCSKDAMALLVGGDISAINEWIGYCIRVICDKVEKDIDFLPPEERIMIAERMWRRRYKERLWDALLEITFQPILNAKNTVIGDNIILNEPEGILASFEAMGLKEGLLDGIVACGISEPSEVRQRAIPPIIKGRNVIVQAPAGSDKTMALCISILQQVDTSQLECQAVVAVSTKEQNDNIMKTLSVLGKFMHVKSHSCMNGNSLREDIRLLSHGVHIIVGTISRIQDMITRKTLHTHHVRLIVFEDCDSICFHNSKDRIDKYIELFSMLTTQICLFSETLTSEVNDLVHDHIKEPKYIEVKREQLSLKNVKQFSVCFDEPNEKLQMLTSLWGTLTMTKTVIYCTCSQKVEWLSNFLLSEEYDNIFIHSDMKRSAREAVLDDFRSGTGSSILITDDIRGMHFEKVPLIINFDPPLYREGYLKRCGRYFNHKAVVINFTLARDIRHMQDIKRFYDIQIATLPVTQVAELAFEVFRIL